MSNHRAERSSTFTEAKATFSNLIDRALSGEPQHIVRNGEEEVIIVDAETYRRALRPEQSLTKLFSAFAGNIARCRPSPDVGQPECECLMVHGLETSV